MNVAYFDEVKYEKGRQDSFWLGGLVLPLTLVRPLESCVDEVAKDVFGTSALSKDTEFHAKEIYHGKGVFRGQPIDDRLTILRRLFDIILQEGEVKRVYVRIIPDNLVITADEPEDIAFMYFVEKIEKSFNRMGGPGMMFGDYDEPRIGKSVASLSQFKSTGTYYSRGIKIENLVDTVYFAHSHHSRMLQLADVFLYALQANRHRTQAYANTELRRHIFESGIAFGCSSKVWPNEPRWYRG